MARDVEFNVTANDKTGPALASAEAKFAATQKRIERAQKESLGTVGKGVIDLASQISPKLGATLTRAFAGAGEAVGPALVAGAIASAPFLSATVSAAVSAGVGLGVAGIGVALAAQDARVQAAGRQLGATLLGALEADASPFISPVLRAIDQVQAKFTALEPMIQRIFATAATFVEPLTRGLVGFTEGVVRGIDQLVSRARPVIDALAAAAANIGDHIGTFFRNISLGSDGAAVALRNISTIFGIVIDAAGILIGELSVAYGWLARLGLDGGAILQGVASVFDKINGAIGGSSRASKDASSSATNLGRALQFTGVAADGLAGSVGSAAAELDRMKAAEDATSAATRSLYSSTTQVAAAFADAEAAARKHTGTLSLSTAAGRANRATLSSLADTLNSNYNAYLKVNGAGAGASALAGQLRSRFISLAQSLGASAADARGLANDLLGIPNVTRTVDVDPGPANTAANKIKAALAGIQNRLVRVNVQLNDPANAFRAPKQAQLDRQDGQARFDANGTFAARAGNVGSVSRTAAPTAVHSNVQVAVNLDGMPLRSYTAHVIRDELDRERWRQKIGPRD